MAAIDPKVAQAVRLRAREVCEYCLSPQRIHRLKFQIEHIIAKQRGGDESLENLALSCGRCNRYKGTNIAGLDPTTGQLTRLFNPRIDDWSEHFHWEGPMAVGSTGIGRTTVIVLMMNHPDELAVRRELIASAVFPPLPPS